MTAAIGDNLVVQGLWIGGRLSALERLCIFSFCAHGHQFHLYHYDKLQNIPQAEGLRLINAEEILPRTAIFRHRKGSLAYFADNFRWELMRQKGGWWMDMDTICIRPLDIAAPLAFVRDIKAHRMLNGMLKFPRGHFLAAALADSYNNVNRIQEWDDVKAAIIKLRRRLLFWQDSRRYIRGRDGGGMISLMSAVRHFGLQDYALPSAAFFLPGDPQGQAVIDGAGYDFAALLSRHSQLRGIHLCNTHLQKAGIDKDGDYAADSLYEVLKRRYAN
ncbi:MAG: hypothetical protein ACR2P4_03835 [Gammaproteobacteria bacterium]